jgi:hypothetical protein
MTEFQDIPMVVMMPSGKGKISFLHSLAPVARDGEGQFITGMAGFGIAAMLQTVKISEGN